MFGMSPKNTYTPAPGATGSGRVTRPAPFESEPHEAVLPERTGTVHRVRSLPTGTRVFISQVIVEQVLQHLLPAADVLRGLALGQDLGPPMSAKAGVARLDPGGRVRCPSSCSGS